MIRTAITTDLPALHALIERAYRGDSAKTGWTHEADLLGGQRTDLATLQEMIADPDQYLLVMLDQGAIIGCVAVTRKDAGTGYLGLLTVDPALQAAGHGRQLIAAAEDRARDFGAGVMEMTVIASRAELIAWYERRGYAVTGERRPFPLDAPGIMPKTDDLEFVVLEKPLQAA